MESLTLALDRNNIRAKTQDQEDEIIESIREILKVLISRVCDVDVTFIEVTLREIKEEVYYIFTPYIENGLVKVYSSFSANILNPERYIGYKLLSQSGLARYALEKLNYFPVIIDTDIRTQTLDREEEWKDIKYTNTDDRDVRYIIVKNEPIAIIKFLSSDLDNPNNNNNSETEITEAETGTEIARVDNYVSKLIKEGYFTYSFGIHNLDDHEIITELCLAFNIEIVDERDLSNMILRTDVDFRVSPRRWLSDNLSLIKSGQFPKFTFHISQYYGDYSRLYGSSYKDILLRYVTYLAYAELSDEDNLLIRPFTQLIEINTDLSITVFLPTYDLVLKLQERIKNKLQEGITTESRNGIYGTYNIEICSNLEQGVIKRWMIQNIDENAFPMVFTSFNGSEVLIHRSKKAIIYPSPFDFDNRSENKVTLASDSLQKALVDYYSGRSSTNHSNSSSSEYYSRQNVCHDNLEPITLETISEMRLDELLHLVPITENNVTYCFSNSSISQLQVHPITRSPLSEETLLRIENIEWGLRGLFDIGPLYGLYDKVASKINIPTTLGMTKVSRVPVDALSRQLVGDIYLIEVIFEDGTGTPLFQISLPTVNFTDLDNLKTYVQKLWEEGYFLNYWSSSIQKYLVNKYKLESYPVLITNEFLLKASTSIYDGQKALNMLKDNYFLQSN